MVLLLLYRGYVDSRRLMVFNSIASWAFLVIISVARVAVEPQAVPSLKSEVIPISTPVQSAVSMSFRLLRASCLVIMQRGFEAYPVCAFPTCFVMFVGPNPLYAQIPSA